MFSCSGKEWSLTAQCWTGLRSSKIRFSLEYFQAKCSPATMCVCVCTRDVHIFHVTNSVSTCNLMYLATGMTLSIGLFYLSICFELH